MTTPEFPNYQQDITIPVENPMQAPRGIPFVDNKYHKPLYKMMKMMMKPKVKVRTPKVKTGRKGKKKVAFH